MSEKMLCIDSMSSRIYLLPTVVWLCHCWVSKIPSVNSITNSLIGHNSLEKTTGNLWHLRSLKLLNLGVLLWKIGRRILCFHCCGSDHRYGVGLIAGSGTSTLKISICKSLRGGLLTAFPEIRAINDSFLKGRFIIHYHSHHSPPLMPLESISFMHCEHGTPRVLFLRVTYQRSLGEWTAVDLRAAPSTSHLLPSLSILFWLHFSPTAQLISTIL